MIVISGAGSAELIEVRLYGDGESSLITFDLKDAPFGIDFKGRYPAKAFLVELGDVNSPRITEMDLSGTSITLQFSSPLPFVDFSNLSGLGQPNPRTEIVVELEY